MVERGNLELSVRNFGPIARADIDLRPFTVFAGPSNTGKSYLAMLIYALHGFVREYLYLENAVIHDPSSVPYLTEEDIKDLSGWMEMVSSQLDSEPVHIPISDSVSESIRIFLHIIEGRSDILSDEIGRSFGVEDVGKLIRHPSRNGSNISLTRGILGHSGLTELVEHKFAIGRRTSKLTAYINDEIPSLFFEWLRDEDIYFEYLQNIITRDISGYRTHNMDKDTLAKALDPLVKAWLHNPLNYRAHYLPSGRAGVMHAHRVVMSALIQRAAQAGIRREEPLPVLSGVHADFLQQLGEFDIYTRVRGHESNAESAERIEREMMKGSVRYENSVTGYPSFFYKPEGWREEIPLMNTSSMVSELAPVALYLRHVVQPGETLIIEEPESHLHPAMQVEFTRQLAAVAKAGVRIIITTHSEWVLDELANLVRLSELPKTRREGIGGADYALTPEELGVWLFEPKNRPRGSVVKEIPFEEEFGGFRSGFDEVAMGTYNDYATISNMVEEDRSG